MSPTETLVVRRALDGDFETIVEIERACFTHGAWNLNSFKHFGCLVCAAGEQVIGFLVARCLTLDRTGEASEHEILDLAVHQDWRRRGVAKTLLRNELASGGKYFLEVRESNVSARSLYESMGFTEIGRRKQYYQYPEETAIVMLRK
jgi:[ribosomal protein S18]-alanine N-acetyltransferase